MSGQCVGYIYANFRKKYTGLELKNLFWEAAKSTVEGDFTCHEKLEQEDFEIFKDLQASGYDHRDIAEAFNNSEEHTLKLVHPLKFLPRFLSVKEIEKLASTPQRHKTMGLFLFLKFTLTFFNLGVIDPIHLVDELAMKKLMRGRRS
uniref:Uncharacterized protein n=1 Tax=Lactuca sativa TaxID=4236 RepID=A0A9R1UTR3_LACSA|nr:hypothetical protein LSAT_V11C800439600 [Lactuca sativa]